MPENYETPPLFEDGASRSPQAPRPAKKRRRGPSVRDPRQAQTEQLTRELLDRTPEEMEAARKAAEEGAQRAKDALANATPVERPQPTPRELSPEALMAINHIRTRIAATTAIDALDDTIVSPFTEEQRQQARQEMERAQAELNERYPRQRTSDEPPHQEGDGWEEVVRDWPTPDPQDQKR